MIDAHQMIERGENVLGRNGMVLHAAGDKRPTCSTGGPDWPAVFCEQLNPDLVGVVGVITSVSPNESLIVGP
jgi:hypothetical protein